MAERALCAALAVISGQTEPLPARSMLTSLDGFKTFIIKVPFLSYRNFSS